MTFEVNYSGTDRLFHRIAFASPAIQLTAANIENTAFNSTWKLANSSRPIFITSLARAGTTLLLEVLHKLPELACHTYRDMPFILSPVLWSKISGRFRSNTAMRERAHGDGVKVGFDSPESFEEVFWKSFWPDHYKESQIRLWKKQDDKPEATAFFREHMKKITALRRPDNLENTRYLSKNNANIARLDFIPQMLPDASILIVLRDPLEHALSLHRQHLNFTQLHTEDNFIKRYMEDIGHYEFGSLHRPFAFEKFVALTEGHLPGTPNYWLAYWIAPFEHIIKTRSDAVIVPYEKVCNNGPGTLAPICEKIGLNTGKELESATSHIRPVLYRADENSFSPALIRRANDIHQQLLEE
jgi:hypothetical protein